ncbi:hypothetical protein A5759_06445 [Mycobacterium sp. 852014-52144_SCH5372336]|nr:hypothetical protein A5759_06445 [Mycobacterium sp. 852014-52144_SCH5372336]
MRADAARNHLRIVTAAIEKLESDGPAVALEDIAQHAGLGVATLHRRFGKREDLIKAAAEHVFTEEIAPAVVEDGPDPWADLVATITGTVQAFSRHSVLLSLAREHAVMGMDTMQAYNEAKERVVSRVREVGAIRPDLTAADLTAVVIMAFAIAQRTSDEFTATNRHLTLLLDGMRPTGRPLPEQPRSTQHPDTPPIRSDQESGHPRPPARQTFQNRRS